MVLKHPSLFGDGFSFLFKNRSGAGMMAQCSTAHSTFVEECTHVRPAQNQLSLALGGSNTSSSMGTYNHT